MTLHSLPKYACPDLTGKPGYWAKALTEGFAESNALIHYFFTPNGDVHFGVNGREKGVFFSGIDTRQPLWCLIDLYGNCTAIELVDLRRSLNNFTVDEDGPEQEDMVEIEPVQPIEADDLVNDLDDLTLDSNSNDEMLLRFNSSFRFHQITFHRSTGLNVSLNGNSTIVWRHEDEYSNGYVFTSEPVRSEERIVIQVLATENMYMGSLAFGLTSANPANIDLESLPEDSDMLLDRPEYWVVSKDVANTPEEGDELSFCVKGDGAVEFSKNCNTPSVLMHVDNSVSLWAFWDVYGNTQRLRIIGSTLDPVIRPDQIRQNSNASLENDRNNLSMSDLVHDMPEGWAINIAPPLPPPRRLQSNQPPQPARANRPGEVRLMPTQPENFSSSSRSREPRTERSEECKICYEATVDAVLYSCGHMCLCYECGLQQWKGRGGGICPMCRNTIQDVIKIYRS